RPRGPMAMGSFTGEPASAGVDPAVAGTTRPTADASPRVDRRSLMRMRSALTSAVDGRVDRKGRLPGARLNLSCGSKRAAALERSINAEADEAHDQEHEWKAQHPVQL